jgi:hypothetical protein
MVRSLVIIWHTTSRYAVAIDIIAKRDINLALPGIGSGA